jgi:transcriptional regulator with XRE-family HTH domain
VTAQPISPATKAFGERVRARRHELGESQEELADACGLHWTFVGQVERGRRNVSLHNILKLAHGLQIDPGELVRGLEAPKDALGRYFAFAY